MVCLDSLIKKDTGGSGAFHSSPFREYKGRRKGLSEDKRKQSSYIDSADVRNKRKQ